MDKPKVCKDCIQYDRMTKKCILKDSFVAMKGNCKDFFEKK